MNWNKSKDIFFIACGHGRSLDGSWDSGCADGKYTEAGLMLPITKYTVKLLRNSGVRVLTDADANNNKNMKACVSWANKNYPACRRYMSIHCDYKNASKGVAPLFVSSSGRAMATKIGKSVAKQMGMKWKGAFKRNDLYELNATKMTSVIFETGMIKEPELRKYKKYGKALAKAICSYIGVKFQLHSNAYLFRVALNITFKEMKQLGFKYEASWKKNALTWAGAKKKKTSSCSTYVCYALQRAKIFDKGEYFWINGDNITCKNGLTLAELKKRTTISHPHKTPKNANLKKGDIVGYKNPAHTQVFAGWTKDGEPKWYSISTGDLKAKKEPRVKPSYTNKVIYTKIRLK